MARYVLPLLPHYSWIELEFWFVCLGLHADIHGGVAGRQISRAWDHHLWDWAVQELRGGEFFKGTRHGRGTLSCHNGIFSLAVR